MGFWDNAGTTILDPDTGQALIGAQTLTPSVISKTSGARIIGRSSPAGSQGEVGFDFTYSAVAYHVVMRDANGKTPFLLVSGNTASRPAGVADGAMYFDTTLGIPIIRLASAGTGWINAAGVSV